MISLPISLSKKYQVNQVNHEVGKKHNKESTYNKPNILILIKIPCKYLVIIPPFPKVIPPCNYLVKHLLQQFIYVFPPPKKPQPIHMAYIMIMVIITPISIYMRSFTNDEIIPYPTPFWNLSSLHTKLLFLIYHLQLIRLSI